MSLEYDLVITRTSKCSGGAGKDKERVSIEESTDEEYANSVVHDAIGKMITPMKLEGIDGVPEGTPADKVAVTSIPGVPNTVESYFKCNFKFRDSEQEEEFIIVLKGVSNPEFTLDFAKKCAEEYFRVTIEGPL